MSCPKCNDTGRLGYQIIKKMVNNKPQEVRNPIRCDKCHRRNSRQIVRERNQTIKDHVELMARIFTPDFEVRSECYG